MKPKLPYFSICSALRTGGRGSGSHIATETATIVSSHHLDSFHTYLSFTHLLQHIIVYSSIDNIVVILEQVSACSFTLS